MTERARVPRCWGLAALALAAVPHVTTLQAACTAAVAAERANLSLYDSLLAGVLPTDVRQVFTNNRAASVDNHLPAFLRCA